MPDITETMLERIKAGSLMLEDSAALHCLKFAKDSLSEITENGGDPYYASFAAAVIGALDSGHDFSKLNSYLKTRNFCSMDMANSAAFARAARFAGFHSEALCSKLLNMRASNPYEYFLQAGAFQDLNICANVDISEIEDFRAPSGGFSNLRHSGFAAPNATAAGICAAICIQNKTDSGALQYILDAQGAEGGFKAQEDSLQPDLLTTASALFAISLAQTAPRFAPEDFIASHWLDDGSFSATVYDDGGDCEYLFYGLLAFGSAS